MGPLAACGGPAAEAVTAHARGRRQHNEELGAAAIVLCLATPHRLRKTGTQGCTLRQCGPALGKPPEHPGHGVTRSRGPKLTPQPSLPRAHHHVLHGHRALRIAGLALAWRGAPSRRLPNAGASVPHRSAQRAQSELAVDGATTDQSCHTTLLRPQDFADPHKCMHAPLRGKAIGPLCAPASAVSAASAASALLVS